MLQDVSMASLTGTLSQLGLINYVAHETLKELFEVAKETSDRIERAAERTRTILEQMTEVEELVQATDGNAPGSVA